MELGNIFRAGIILQVLCLIHFMRRRPDTYWVWIIIIGGPIGSLAYIVMEVIPDLTVSKPSFRFLSRRNRIHELQRIVEDNPAAGNYEELADLLREDGKYLAGRDAYNRAITAHTREPNPFYGRAQSEIALNDFAAAESDLRRVVEIDPKYDFQRAGGLLAFVLARNGKAAEAEAMFREVTRTSVNSETMVNFAEFLLEQGRAAEARSWTEAVLKKKNTLPSYLKRRERPWFRRAAALLKRIPASNAVSA